MTPNPKPYIAEFGGKAGGYFYLRDLGGFEEHLPGMIAFLGKDEKFSKITDRFQNSFSPVIIRGSHPNDYWGLVDIIHTEKNVTDKGVLGAEITSIRGRANSPKVFSYNGYEREFYKDKEEWQEYDGKIRIMVQPFINGLRGSMVEHPHKKGAYLINIVRHVGGMDVIDDVVLDNEIHQYTPAPDEISKDRQAIEEIVTLYKKVRETGFIPEDYSFQMEFGLDDDRKIYFYQARPFRKFEEPPFSMDSTNSVDYTCFGITPEKGVELEVIKIRDNPEDVNTINHPFALVLDVSDYSKRGRYLQGPDFQPRNMAAFLPARGGNLEHGTFRWLTKADVSIFPYLNQVYLKKVQTGDRIRITSNGLNYNLEKLD